MPDGVKRSNGDYSKYKYPSIHSENKVNICSALRGPRKSTCLSIARFHAPNTLG